MRVPRTNQLAGRELMTKVSITTHIPISAEKVWDIIGHFNALPDWHPGVESSELEEGGKVRRLSLVGGGTIVERLERIDDSDRRYRYSILESPLPVTNYVAELHVKPDEDSSGCTVEWSSDFEPKGTSTKDAMEVMQGIYKAGLDNLKKLFGS
jgi:hypothetical protein